MPPKITRVRLRDYRSIAACDVQLQPLTLLVGPNGSGKSNFLDSLRFVSDCMVSPLEQVVAQRWGVLSIFRKKQGGTSSTRFAIHIDFVLSEVLKGTYSLEIGCGADGTAVIEQERCQVGSSGFAVERGRIQYSGVAPASTGDRPALVAFGASPEFAPVFHLMAGLAFYTPAPVEMRRPSAVGPGKVLLRDASNAADVLWRLAQSNPVTLARIRQYLAAFNPEFNDLAVTDSGNYRWLAFIPARQPISWRLNSSDVSDGTLRAVAILLAVFQTQMPDSPLRLIGLEEPESNLHPAAAGVLLDALLEASRTVPIIASTHSADLLDRQDVPENSIITVSLQDGVTVLAPVDESTKSILHRRLYTAGELLRSNQLGPALGELHE